MEIDTNTVISITSSGDDEAANGDKKKRMAEHLDFHGFEYFKGIIEARASIRRKKRKKKNKNKCSQKPAFLPQDQVRVDAATEEQQFGQAKVAEIREVTETESLVVPGNAVPQEITEQVVHEMTITPTLQVTPSPTSEEETKSPTEIVSSPILEVSAPQEKATSIQIAPSTILEVSAPQEKATSMQVAPSTNATSEPLVEAGRQVTVVQNQGTSRRPHLIFPQIRPPPMAPSPVNYPPSDTIGSSISAQNFSNLQMVSRNLLDELSSRAKTLNSSLNDETCTSSLVLVSDLLGQQRKVLATFLKMSLEDIYHANAFDNIERTALTLVQLTSNPLERSALEDLISHLAQFKENVPNAVTLAEAARAQRSSLPEKIKILDTILDQNQEQLGSLEAEFSKLEEAAAEVDAQIQHLITKKEELLFQRNSVALKLEKANQEASKALGEWRSLEKENKEANDSWLRANQMLVEYNGVWKHFGKNFSL